MTAIGMMAAMAAAVMATLAGAAQAAPQKAVIAGGCFWCVEADMEKLPGVISAVSGYTGGTLDNPTYQDVTGGGTGHYEAVEVTFDDSQISYPDLIHAFLRSIDVLDAGGQFCDRGDSYRTAIFVDGKAQREAAATAIAEAERDLGQKVVTKILDLRTFWPAEDYHQGYYQSSEYTITRRGPMQRQNAYAFYREACGRDTRVKQVWGAEALAH